MTEPTPIPEGFQPIRPGEERRPPQPPAENPPQPQATTASPRPLKPASAYLERPPLPEQEPGASVP